MCGLVCWGVEARHCDDACVERCGDTALCLASCAVEAHYQRGGQTNQWSRCDPTSYLLGQANGVRLESALFLVVRGVPGVAAARDVAATSTCQRYQLGQAIPGRYLAKGFYPTWPSAPGHNTSTYPTLARLPTDFQCRCTASGRLAVPLRSSRLAVRLWHRLVTPACQWCQMAMCRRNGAPAPCLPPALSFPFRAFLGTVKDKASLLRPAMWFTSHPFSTAN